MTKTDESMHQQWLVFWSAQWFLFHYHCAGHAVCVKRQHDATIDFDVVIFETYVIIMRYNQTANQQALTLYLVIAETHMQVVTASYKT